MRTCFRSIAFLILFLRLAPGYAQYNYVPNPSFEEYDSTAIYTADSSFYGYYFYAKYWFNPVNCGYCNYFNSRLNWVASFQDGGEQYSVPQTPWSYTYPYEGTAMSAFCPFSLPAGEGLRNYLEVKLKDPLIGGKKYCVRFFVTLEDSCYFAIDQLGVYFSYNSVTHYAANPPCYLLVSPQIVSPEGEYFNVRDKWQEVSGTYAAMGGERYLTLGNFRVDSATHYVWLPDQSGNASNTVYHIDMVSVTECDTNIHQPFAGADTTICLGDSVMLGVVDTTTSYTFEWLPVEGLSDSSVSNPVCAATESTTYILQQWYYHSFLRTDTVTITVLDCSPPPPDTTEPRDNGCYIPNVFSPNGDGQNDVFYVRGNNLTQVSLKIYDRWGRLVFESDAVDAGWDGRCKGSDCALGVYFFSVAVSFGTGETLQKMGNVTLVR